MLSQEIIRDILRGLYAENPALDPEKNLRLLAQTLNTTPDDVVALILTIAMTSAQDIATEVRISRRERLESYANEKFSIAAKEILANTEGLTEKVECLIENTLSRLEDRLEDREQRLSQLAADNVLEVQACVKEAVNDMKKVTSEIQDTGERLKLELEAIRSEVSKVIYQWTCDLEPLVERSIFRAHRLGWCVIFIVGCLGVSLCAFFVFLFMVKLGIFLK